MGRRMSVHFMYGPTAYFDGLSSGRSFVLSVSTRCLKAVGSILTLVPATCVGTNEEVALLTLSELGLMLFAIFASSM
jgi:hypothetical protein